MSQGAALMLVYPPTLCFPSSQFPSLSPSPVIQAWGDSLLWFCSCRAMGVISYLR